MSTEQALTTFAATAADAVAAILTEVLPAPVAAGEPHVLPAGAPALAGAPAPGVVVEARFAEDEAGGTLFVTTVLGARRLADAFAGAAAGDDVAALTDPERVAVAAGTARMLDAAVGAVDEVLGLSLPAAKPVLHPFATEEAAVALGGTAPHVAVVALDIAGEPAAIVQLVPKATLVRLTRALEERTAAVIAAEAAEPGDAVAGAPHEILRSTRLRVSAEIGRARMPLARAVALPAGGVVELDRGAEDPVDLYVNGRRFATGRLVLVDEEWAVRVDEVFLDVGQLSAAVG